MDNKENVVILGSGMSILDLGKDELDYINNCKHRIAMNKFMAFYEKSKIIPNEIYFNDVYGYYVFLYIVRKCVSQNIKGLTFYIHPFLKMLLYKRSYVKNFFSDLWFRLLAMGKIILKLNVDCDFHRFILFRKFEYIRISDDYNLVSLRLNNWLKGGQWANDFKSELFHFRGSLTTCINVASIIEPGADVLLVGNDFNGSEYFYEKELNESGVKWKDYTFDQIKKAGVHYSFQNVNGHTMEEKFPFILRELQKRGMGLYCLNKDSLLVTKANVPYLNLKEYLRHS